MWAVLIEIETLATRSLFSFFIACTNRSEPLMQTNFTECWGNRVMYGGFGCSAITGCYASTLPVEVIRSVLDYLNSLLVTSRTLFCPLVFQPSLSAMLPGVKEAVSFSGLPVSQFQRQHDLVFLAALPGYSSSVTTFKSLAVVSA